MRADGVAWVWAALVRDLVCPTCSSANCWVALTCSACTSVAAWSSSSPCYTASPSIVPMPLHNSCAPEAPDRETSNLSLAYQSAFCRLPPLPAAQPIPLLLAGLNGCPAARLSLQLAFQKFPLGATGAGAGAAATLRLPGAVALGAGRRGTSHCL